MPRIVQSCSVRLVPFAIDHTNLAGGLASVVLSYAQTSNAVLCVLRADLTLRLSLY